MTPSVVTGRAPPHNLDAEAAVLSASLLYREALDAAAERLKPEHFYSTANGEIFAAALALVATGKPVDLTTVANHLRTAGRLAEVGGAKYLAMLVNETPSRANVDTYADIVRENWRVRRIIATCQRIEAEGYMIGGAAAEWIESAEVDFLAAASDVVETETIPTLAEVMIDRAVDLCKTDGKPCDGLSSGVRDLDALMGPMLPGSVVLIAAHSGVGKTSLAMQVALHVATNCYLNNERSAVLVVSQEMTAAELADRALCTGIGIDTRSISTGLHPHDMTRMLGAAEQIRTRGSGLHGIFIDDRPGVKPDQLRRRARRVAREAKRMDATLGLIIVDYIQLMDGSDGGKRASERFEREVAYISKELKKLAKQLKCVVIALAQLNEDARTEKRFPRGEDLSQCKALRHDADKVILINNDSALERRTQERDDEAEHAELPSEVVQLIVDKNRGGREGMVHVIFRPSHSSFGDMEIAARRAYIEDRKRQREQTREPSPGRSRR